MLSWLPKPLIGIFSILAYSLNLLFFSCLIYLVALLKVGRPGPKRQIYFEKIVHRIACGWAYINDGIQWLTSKTEWDIQSSVHLSREQWYLLIANHQNWADIIILEKAFVRNISMLKFFLKEELRWTPLVGTTCWALNFPFMRRYSKAFLAKNPHLRGKDLETTKKACEQYKISPTTLINFAEGTRFSLIKQQAQSSPFNYLLKPKAGGLAFTLSAMDGILKEMINVTIVYHGDKVSAWDFFCGTVRKITVKFDLMPIHSEMIGDYDNDPQYREKLQQWLNALWEEKDQLIGAIKVENK